MIDELTERLTLATTAAPDTGTALDQIAGLYQEAASLIDALRTLQAECKAAIGEIMLETGETDITTSTARCYVTRPYITASYDRKGLDELAANDDELAVLLKPYRRERTVDGVLTIRTARQD